MTLFHIIENLRAGLGSHCLEGQWCEAIIEYSPTGMYVTSHFALFVVIGYGFMAPFQYKGRCSSCGYSHYKEKTVVRLKTTCTLEMYSEILHIITRYWAKENSAIAYHF